MNPTLELLRIFISLFLPLLLYYSLIKIVRTAILSTNRWINLDDINIIFIASVILALIAYQSIDVIKYFAFVMLLIYWLLLWIDAIIFYLYSFEINRQNISDFLNDFGSMLHYSARSFELFKRYPWIIIMLPLSIASIYSSLFILDNSIVLSIALPTMLTAFIFVLQKFKQAIFRNIILLLIIVISVLGASKILLPFTINIVSVISIIISLAIFISIFILNVCKKIGRSNFFNLDSHFRKFLRDERINIDLSINIKPEHQKLVDIQCNKFIPSKYFGALKDSNIILITAESVGSKYLSKSLRLPFLTKMAEGSVVSNNHYAISPHTNQFFLHMFNSNYTPVYNHNLYQLLVNANYSTMFVSSADMNICESRKLLEKIGYKKIIDKNTLYDLSKKEGDYLLLDSIPFITEELRKAPCFIQLLTVQSHYPYDVIDKKKFDQRIISDLKTKYLNTVEETDYVLNKMLIELSKYIFLDDTLIIYVGDHGESFGELGYKAHSNSTINAQLKVPFYIKHKTLIPETVQFSTHFDIVPTILDLLGIEYNNLIGNSIFCENRKLPGLYYSMVKKGNVPANVKIKTSTENIMIDRVLDYSVVVDEYDQIVRHLSNEEKIYYNTLIYRMLSERNLIEL